MKRDDLKNAIEEMVRDLVEDLFEPDRPQEYGMSYAELHRALANDVITKRWLSDVIAEQITAEMEKD